MQIIQSILKDYEKSIINDAFIDAMVRDSFVNEIFNFINKNNITIGLKDLRLIAKNINAILPNEDEVYIIHFDVLLYNIIADYSL